MLPNKKYCFEGCYESCFYLFGRRVSGYHLLSQLCHYVFSRRYFWPWTTTSLNLNHNQSRWIPRYHQMNIITYHWKSIIWTFFDPFLQAIPLDIESEWYTVTWIAFIGHDGGDYNDAFIYSKGACTNHVDSMGGRGVGQMSTFVYVGGRGCWDNVYMVFFPYNFTNNF